MKFTRNITVVFGRDVPKCFTNGFEKLFKKDFSKDLARREGAQASDRKKIKVD